MDLLKMAQDAGFDVHPRKGEIRSALDFCANDITATVEKFARLVAAAEREACAAMLDAEAARLDKLGVYMEDVAHLQKMAAAMRSN